jgi:type II secretory pathway component PulJ
VTGQRQEPIKKNQRGFTLIAVLIITAITGIIGSGILTVIFQVYQIQASGLARMIAVKEVERAVHWITRDALMAQEVYPPDPLNDSGFPITLKWIEWNNTSNSVEYRVQGGELQRNVSINGGQPTMTVVINCLKPDATLTNCDFTDGILAFKITAGKDGFGSANETRTFNVVLRALGGRG